MIPRKKFPMRHSPTRRPKGRTPSRAARVLRLLLAGACLALIATSAGAGYFTVTLANGTTFETRERPIVAEWDENFVQLRTDQGNWISLAKEDVVDVTSVAESSGFGYQVDSTTLFIGFNPGDITVEGEEGEEGAGGAAPPGPPDDTPISYGGSTGGYGLDQFLDIPDDGLIDSQPLVAGGDE